MYVGIIFTYINIYLWLALWVLSFSVCLSVSLYTHTHRSFKTDHSSASIWTCRYLRDMYFGIILFATAGKESACYVGDLRSITGLGRSPGEANGNPIQYSCLENSMDRGTRQATVHGVANSKTRLSDFQFPLITFSNVLGILMWTIHLPIFLGCTKLKNWEVVLRWQRNMMGRPLSLPKIHQKNIWTLSKFHKTTSECWQRTSGTQKSSPFSSKGGREKYKRQKENKRGRDGTPSQEGSLKNGEVSKHQETLTAESVASLGTTEGNIIGRKNK